MKKTVILTAMAFLFALFLIPGFSHAQEKTALNQRLGSRLYDSEVSEAFSTGEGDDGILLVQMRPSRRSPRPLPPPRPRRPRYQEPRRTFGFGGRLTVSNYSGDEFSYAPYNIDADFDNGFGFGGNFTLFPVPFFSAEFSVDYIFTELKYSSPGIMENMGDVVQIPLLFTARFHFPGHPAISPYLGLGAGFYINSLDSKPSSVAAIYNRRGYIDLDNSFGFHITGGLELFVMPVGAITIDLKHVWTESDIDTNIPNIAEHSISLNRFQIGVGYKMYF